MFCINKKTFDAGRWTLDFRYLLLLMIFTFSSCQTTCECVTPPPSATDMFPTEVGRYVEYDVAEQDYGLGRAVINRNYQLKEHIVEMYTGVDGSPVYRIARYRRIDDSQRWQVDSTITLRLTPNQVIRNENGKEYIKMVFPLQEKSYWNANVYNNLGEDKYEMRNIGKPYSVNNQSFDYAVTILQQNDSTLVGQDKRLEIYARTVGLIYKEKSILQYCTSSPSCVGKNQIDYGIKQIIKFRKAGKE